MAEVKLDHNRRTDVGVVIARMQAVRMTDGHKHLLDAALDRHDRVILFLGDRPARRQLKHALDFKTREQMVRGQYSEAKYPNLEIERLVDIGNNELWSEDLDKKIGGLCPNENAVLYGGRESFIDQYYGLYDVCEVVSIASESGTDTRELACKEPIDSEDFRAGCFYAVGNDYPVAYQAIDVAVMRVHRGKVQVLLGKKHESQQGWNFIGGISDPDDETLEYTCRREGGEETEVIIAEESLKYVGSKKVRDWRYVDGRDDIKTALFITYEWEGRPKPTEELRLVQWHDVDDLHAHVTKSHEPLAEMLQQEVERHPPLKTLLPA